MEIPPEGGNIGPSAGSVGQPRNQARNAHQFGVDPLRQGSTGPMRLAEHGLRRAA